MEWREEGQAGGAGGGWGGEGGGAGRAGGGPREACGRAVIYHSDVDFGLTTHLKVEQLGVEVQWAEGPTSGGGGGGWVNRRHPRAERGVALVDQRRRLAQVKVLL